MGVDVFMESFVPACTPLFMAACLFMLVQIACQIQRMNIELKMQRGGDAPSASAAAARALARKPNRAAPDTEETRDYFSLEDERKPSRANRSPRPVGHGTRPLKTPRHSPPSTPGAGRPSASVPPPPPCCPPAPPQLRRLLLRPLPRPPNRPPRPLRRMAAPPRRLPHRPPRRRIGPLRRPRRRGPQLRRPGLASLLHRPWTVLRRRPRRRAGARTPHQTGRAEPLRPAAAPRAPSAAVPPASSASTESLLPRPVTPPSFDSPAVLILRLSLRLP